MIFKKLRRKIIFTLLFILFGMVDLIYAQDKEAPKPSAEFSGQTFMNWHSGLTKGNKTNTFELERLYLNWQEKFNDMFSARVTLDVGNDSVIEGATQATDAVKTNQGGSITSKYRVYVKLVYLQAKETIGPVDSLVKVGMIDPPIIGFIDGFEDQRWIHKNLIDDAKNVLPGGTSLDNSADMGISLGADIMKMVNLTFALTNGEGYKNTNESLFASTDKSKNSSQGKAIYARVGVTPITPLNIFGFYRYEGTSSDQANNNKGFYGAGIAWKDDLFKAGGYYALPFQKLDGKDATYTNEDKKKMSLMEFWLTATPQKFFGIPLFVSARFGIGNDSSQKDSKTTYMGAGMGYEYSKNFRVIAWYDQYDIKANSAAGKPNPAKLFSIKAEVKI